MIFVVEVAQLPVFVYGTLRLGQLNHGLLAGRTEGHQAARMRGLRLHDAGWIPYAIETGDKEIARAVVGEVHHLAPAQYTSTLARLDRLEGFDPSRPHASHYLRVRRTAELLDGARVDVWIYVVANHDAARVGALPVVASGDWLTR